MKTLHKKCTSHLLASGLLFGTSLCTVAIATDDTPVVETKTKEVATSELPAAKDLIERALTAMGGREAIDKIESSLVKATMATPMGELTMESYFRKPGQFLLKQTIPGMGEVAMGSDGDTAWVRNPMMGGYELLDPADAKDLRGQASMHNIVSRLEKEFTDLQTVERASFHEVDCYKLRMVDKDGQEQFAFFNIENQLIAGMEMTQQGTKATMRFEKWEKRGDIKMFTRMVINQMGMNMTMNITELEFDKVDQDVFALPAEVKKLADERSEESEDAEENPS